MASTRSIEIPSLQDEAVFWLQFAVDSPNDRAFHTHDQSLKPFPVSRALFDHVLVDGREKSVRNTSIDTSGLKSGETLHMQHDSKRD